PRYTAARSRRRLSACPSARTRSSVALAPNSTHMTFRYSVYRLTFPPPARRPPACCPAPPPRCGRASRPPARAGPRLPPPAAPAARAEAVVLLADPVEVGGDFGLAVQRHHQHHADPHVECAQHLLLADPPLFLEIPEHRQDRPGAGIDAGRHAARQDARDVVR